MNNVLFKITRKQMIWGEWMECIVVARQPTAAMNHLRKVAEADDLDNIKIETLGKTDAKTGIVTLIFCE